MTNKTLGIIAGNGILPAMVANGAHALGIRVVVAGLRGEVGDALKSMVDHYVEVPIGNLGAIVRAFHDHGAQQAVMVGGVSKKRLFSRARPDRLAAKLLLRLRHMKDDNLLCSLANLLAEEGVEIVDASAFVRDALAPQQVLTRRTPTKGELLDIGFGFELLRDLAPVDVGQTVVVRAGVILAIEVIEGTDVCIRRGAEMGQGNSYITRGGVVVCKGVKPGQDRRFDLPAIGVTTIEVCRQAGVRVLAVEAGGTLLLDRDAIVAAANKARMTVLGVSRHEGGVS